MLVGLSALPVKTLSAGGQFEGWVVDENPMVMVGRDTVITSKGTLLTQ